MAKSIFTYTATASQLRDGVRLHAAQSHRFRLRPHGLSLLEVDDVLFGTDSAVVMPCPLDGDGTPEIVADQDTALSAQGLGLFYVVFRYAKQNPDARLLIAGHTDTSGRAAHNLSLSSARAATVYAILRGQRSLWMDTCDAWHRVADVQRLLKYHAFRNDFEALDPGPIDDAMGPKTRSALEVFQIMYNEQRQLLGVGDRPELAVDGVMGPQTWGAVFDFYQFDLAQMLGGAPVRTVRRLLGLSTDAPDQPASGAEEAGAGMQRLRLDRWREVLQPVDPAHPYVGLGESFPIDDAHKDNYRSKTNRRVAFLFFESADVPTLPPERPANGATYTILECPFYDTESYQRRTIQPGKYFAHQLEFQTVNEMDQPVPNADIVLQPLTGGKIEVQSNGDGYCMVEEVPPGLVRILLPDGTSAGMSLNGGVVQAVLSTQNPAAGDTPIASVIVEFSLSEEGRSRHRRTQRGFSRSAAPSSRPIPLEDDRARPNVAPPQSERSPEASKDTFYAHDNLALVVGDRADGFDRTVLYDVVDEWVQDHHPVVAQRGFVLMVLDGKQLHCMDAKGSLVQVFDLEETAREQLRGSVGAYAAYATPGDPLFRDMSTKSRIITLEGHDEDGHIPLETLLPSDVHDDVLSYLGDAENHVQILYYAPTNTAQLQQIALQGGAGVLEAYAADTGTHDRNEATVRYVARVYQGYLQRYINQVRAIGGSELEELAALVSRPNLTDAQRAEARSTLRSTVKEEVAELKRMGPPERIYRFPEPVDYPPELWLDLAGLNNESDYTAWRAISSKLDDIADQHSEGAVFFRVKVSLEKSVGKGEAEPGDGHFAGGTAKVESTIDVGTDGLIVKRNLLAVGTAKIGPNQKGLTLSEMSKRTEKKPETGATVEGEWNIETGEQKTTFKGKIKDVGAEVSTDGNVKLTAPHGASAEYNVTEQQFGQGVEIPTPGGSVYLGLHMQGILEESITAYLTGAPGFFERRHPYDFFDSALRWSELTGVEQENLTVLGWDASSWNLRGETPFDEFPESTQGWFDLSDRQKRSATQLGMDRRDWKKWKLAAQPPDAD